MPESLSPERHRDLQGRSVEPIVRRVWVTLIAALIVAALLGVFGQRASDASNGPLLVSGPKRVRGGLIYEVRFDVTAPRRLAAPRLVLNRGWFDGLTINTTTPDPAEELNRDGQVVLEYGALAPRERLHVWLQVQVNPTAIGSRTQTVSLQDGQTPVATVTRHLAILP